MAFLRGHRDEDCVDICGVAVVNVVPGKVDRFGPIVVPGHSSENLDLTSGL